MSGPNETVIYQLAPPPNQSRARPDSTKIFGGWQSGLETLSGCKQLKLRLRLVASCKPAPEPQRQNAQPSLRYSFNARRGQVCNRVDADSHPEVVSGVPG